jgi:hypothetical protein
MQEHLQNVKPNRPKPTAFANFLLPQHLSQQDPQHGQCKPQDGPPAPAPHLHPARHPFVRSLLRFSSSLPARICIAIIAVMLALNATPSEISISAHPRLATWQSLGRIFRWRGDYDIFYRDSQVCAATHFVQIGGCATAILFFIYV